MRQTLIDIQWLYKTTAQDHQREPTADELAHVIRRRMSQVVSQEKYMRGMGEFIGAALTGVVIDPREWNPPD